MAKKNFGIEDLLDGKDLATKKVVETSTKSSNTDKKMSKTFVFTKDQDKRLKVACAMLDLKEHELLREALNEYYEKRGL